MEGRGAGVIKDYKDLRVWQKAMDVACDIIELVEMLPKGPAGNVVSEQIIGSSTSVSANIAEGHSSGSGREYHRILRIAYREAKETDNWLQVIKKSAKFATESIIAFVNRIEGKNVEVLKMLSSLKKKLSNLHDR